MTAHKAQGRTLDHCIVNLTGCRGTESPYVMLSRATSLEGLVILTPFSKDRICSRRSEEARVEFRRLEYLNLKTVIQYGTEPEKLWATERIRQSYGTAAQAREPPVVSLEGGDVWKTLDEQQRATAMLTAPNIRPAIRRGKLPVTSAGIAAAAAADTPSSSTATNTFSLGSSATAAYRPTQMKRKKRDLDDPPAPKRNKRSRKS
ncbi:hypothetical protein FB451DRAFT_1460875 [Mycena latifolia]|nr:hypothetical protein FB451DRAFT_1460875 [Mycena latifolia]